MTMLKLDFNIHFEVIWLYIVGPELEKNMTTLK